MKQGFRVYDTHAHLGVALHSGRVCGVDEMLRHMDRAGADRSLLIPFPVVEDARQAHDQIGRAVRDHPDRFTGSACLYPFGGEREFREEVKRCALEWGFRAMKLQPMYQALNPVSSRSNFYFETALEHNMAVVVHTGSGAPFALPSLYIRVARDFPELRIVLGHAGGSVYYLEAVVAAMTCPNLYIDLSSLMPHHVEEVLAYVGPGRLMIGSDIPGSLETEMSKILTMDLAGDVKRRILWSTARAVFDGAAE